jgi:hypothetical protein
MAQALYVCYVCQLAFVLPPSHPHYAGCQPECDPKMGIHRDFCPRCHRKLNLSMEAQLKPEPYGEQQLD